MSCHGNNATAPSPAIAPGGEAIDPAAAAVEAAAAWGGKGMDPRVTAVVPGFDAPFFQAGLAGYSDAPMRIVARRHGCPFCVTEALLDRLLLGGGHGFDKADLELIRDNVPGGDEDRPTAGQIIGSDPDEMAAAALKMIEQGRRRDAEYRAMAYEQPGVLPSTRAKTGASGIGHAASGKTEASGIGHRASAQAEACNASTVFPDARCPMPDAPPPSSTFSTLDVNLACPVKKIQSKARGGHWLAEPTGAIEILRAVREAVPREIPCTVKLRRGFDDTPEAARNFEIIFEAAYELGYAWATVHARTVQQKYMGPSRWSFLKELVARHPDRPVFGSGDVWGVGDIFRMIAYTGVSAVSVARGCIGNPWIFRQARQMMAGGPPLPPTVAEQRAVLEEHFRLAAALSGDDTAGKTMRKFGIKFAQHHPLAGEVKARMIGITCFEDWMSVLEEQYGVGETAPA